MGYIKNITFTPFKINIGDRNNYVRLFSFDISTKDKENVFKCENSYTLLGIGFFNIHSCGSHIISVRASILFKTFKLYSKLLKPEWDKCVVCGEWCRNNTFYSEDTPICSDDCLYEYNINQKN